LLIFGIVWGLYGRRFKNNIKRISRKYIIITSEEELMFRDQTTRGGDNVMG
jgi:hypothetical protein